MLFARGGRRRATAWRTRVTLVAAAGIVPLGAYVWHWPDPVAGRAMTTGTGVGISGESFSTLLPVAASARPSAEHSPTTPSSPPAPPSAPPTSTPSRTGQVPAEPRATATPTPRASSPRPTPTSTPAPPPPGFDLIVTSVALQERVRAGEQVRFTATIANRGSDPSPDGIIHGVRFGLDGDPIAWSDYHVTAIPPGGSVTVTSNGGESPVWTAVAGKHRLSALVDDINRMPGEYDEGNNRLSVNVRVR